MQNNIYILHERPAMAEVIAWSLELGTDWKAFCLKEANELKEASPQPDLLICEADLFDETFPKNDFPVLVIAGTIDDDKVMEALYAGAEDVVDPGNGPGELIEKVEQALNHPTIEKNVLIRRLIQKNKGMARAGMDETDYGLTLKEKEVLRMMKEGNHLKQVARLTNSAYETVRTHVKHIYKKIGVMSASEAVIKAMKMDI